MDISDYLFLLYKNLIHCLSVGITHNFKGVKNKRWIICWYVTDHKVITKRNIPTNGRDVKSVSIYNVILLDIN